MAKNSFCYPDLPEEETITHHFHATASSLQLQEELLPTTNNFEFQEPFEGFPDSEDRAAAATQSHRQAEKRRRDRINAQLARLRRLIPKSEKMDKAALLERVVDEVKDLKRKASEISKLFTIPTEIDDVTIECNTNTTMHCFPKLIHGHHDHHDDDDNNNNNNNMRNNIMLMKATFCCEDRPDLIPELIRALKDLNLSIIEAEIACLGGRMKSILLLYYKYHDNNNNNNNYNNNNEGDNHVVCDNVSGLKKSLMGVLTRVISWSNASTSNYRVTSKRQRFFFSS